MQPLRDDEAESHAQDGEVRFAAFAEVVVIEEVICEELKGLRRRDVVLGEEAGSGEGGLTEHKVVVGVLFRGWRRVRVEDAAERENRKDAGQFGAMSVLRSVGCRYIDVPEHDFLERRELERQKAPVISRQSGRCFSRRQKRAQALEFCCLGVPRPNLNERIPHSIGGAGRPTLFRLLAFRGIGQRELVRVVRSFVPWIEVCGASRSPERAGPAAFRDAQRTDANEDSVERVLLFLVRLVRRNVQLGRFSVPVRLAAAMDESVL